MASGTPGGGAESGRAHPHCRSGLSRAARILRHARPLGGIIAAAACAPRRRRFARPSPECHDPHCRSPRSAPSLARAWPRPSADAGAKTLRWAGRGDPQTTDPHSQNENLTNNINALVYETLVTRDRRPRHRARRWRRPGSRSTRRPGASGCARESSSTTARRSPPTTWCSRFQRAREDTSQIRAYANARGKPRKIDDLTVEFVTDGPNPILLEHIATIYIMSQAWCEKNKADEAARLQEQGGDRSPRGRPTAPAPYVLKSREPDVKTVLVKNPDWWGWKDKRFDGNVDELVYTPIGNDATRLAALVAGEVDLVNDPPPQDVPRLRRRPASR